MAFTDFIKHGLSPLGDMLQRISTVRRAMETAGHSADYGTLMKHPRLLKGMLGALKPGDLDTLQSSGWKAVSGSGNNAASRLGSGIMNGLSDMTGTPVLKPSAADLQVRPDYNPGKFPITYGEALEHLKWLNARGEDIDAAQISKELLRPPKIGVMPVVPLADRAALQSNYAAAMMARAKKDGSVYPHIVDIGRMARGFLENPRGRIVTTNGQGQYMAGRNIGGIFMMTHPGYTMDRAGLNYIKSLGENEAPVATAVLDDMTPMLERLGFSRAGETLQPWNGQTVKKNVMVNKGARPYGGVLTALLHIMHRE